MNILLNSMKSFFEDPWAYVDKKMELSGRVISIRQVGQKLSFIILSTPYGDIQCVLENMQAPSKDSVISLLGFVKKQLSIKSGIPGMEIAIKNLSVLSENKADHFCSDDKKRSVISVDLTSRETRAIFELRSVALRAMREHLHSLDFIEVYTPKIVGNSSEGPLDAFSVSYFDKQCYLSVSNLLFHAALVASGLPRVYEIGPCFRGNKSHTKTHLNEYTTVDYTASFINRDELMSLTNSLIRSVVADIELTHLGKISKKHLDVMSESVIVDYVDIFDYLNSRGCSIVWGETRPIPKEGLSLLRDRYGVKLVWVINQPVETNPFYLSTALNKKKEKVSVNCRLLHPYLGSIFDGGERLIDVKALQENIIKRNLNPESFNFYTDCIARAAPSMAGGGIGFDRFFQALLGLDDIRQVVLLPLDSRSNPV